MNRVKNLLQKITLLSSLIAICSCKPHYGIFKVTDDEKGAEVKGIIRDRSINDFNKMMADFPNIKTLYLVKVDGSDVSSDETSDGALDLGRAIYSKGLNTHLVDYGSIDSGGTDLFAAGRTTSVGADPIIGVHSWDGGWDENDKGTAWDIRFDEAHPQHRNYIQYFKDIGFSDKKAKDFYFFTIRAAEPKNIHEMSLKEIDTYLIR